MWYVYIVRCCDQTLYTGITEDLERRVKEHNTGTWKGAKYTSARRPVTLVYQQAIVGTRGDAMKAELAMKRKTRKQKERIILGA